VAEGSQWRRTRAWAAGLPFLLAAAGLLSACSGASPPSGPAGASAPNGVETLSADQILARAKAAAKSASSVHLSGTESGTTVDLSVGRNIATGTVTEGGLTVALLAVGGTTYVRASAAFWDSTSGAASASALAGKWVVAGSATGGASALVSFTDIGRVVDQVLAPTGPLTRTQVSTLDGRRVIGVTSSQDGDTLYVALDGPPYPVRIVPAGGASAGSGSAAGPPTFSAWNAPVVVHSPPPDQVVNLSGTGG
jgi:hypothetical protein